VAVQNYAFRFPPQITKVDSFSDLLAAFTPQWTSPVLAGGSGGGGIWEAGTPTGPASIRRHRSDDNTVGLHDEGGLGSTDAAGISRTHRPLVGEDDVPELRQPERFSEGMAGGIALEFPTETDCGLHLALDTTSYSDPRFCVGYLKGVLRTILLESERGPVRSVGSVLHRCEVELRLRRVHEGCHRRRDARRQDWPFAPKRAEPETPVRLLRGRQLRNEVWFAAVRKG
jgi:hypothetical protein